MLWGMDGGFSRMKPLLSFQIARVNYPLMIVSSQRSVILNRLPTHRTITPKILSVGLSKSLCQLKQSPEYSIIEEND